MFKERTYETVKLPYFPCSTLACLNSVWENYRTAMNVCFSDYEGVEDSEAMLDGLENGLYDLSAVVVDLVIGGATVTNQYERMFKEVYEQVKDFTFMNPADVQNYKDILNKNGIEV